MKKLLFAFTAVLLLGCGSATEITGSWKQDSVNPSNYSSIVVTSMTSNMSARQTVENDLTRELEKLGLQASRSLDVLPPGFTQPKEVDREELLAKIRKSRADAILTVALINKETEERFVPGTYGYQPITRFQYYGRFSGYYTTWYPTLYSPGYYTEDKIYFIEINMYDARTENLVWSVQSETYNPESLSSFSKDFSKTIVNKMVSDGVITPKSQARQF